MNARIGSLVLTVVVTLLSNQPARPVVPACESCGCKEYGVVRLGLIYHSLGKPNAMQATKVDIVVHAWPSADGNSRRLAAVCDVGAPTLQTQTFKHYVWPATAAACTLANVTANDALECADSTDVPIVGGPDMTQQLCKLPNKD